MKKVTGIIIGAVLIACGVLYFLNVFEIADFEFSLNGWWTLFIIIPCLDGILTGKDKVGSALGLAVGILLLLAARDVFGYDMIWKVVAPLIVVALGIKMIAKSLRTKNNTDVAENGEEIK